MTWVQLGGSLVAILLLAGVARALRLGESRIADPATARRLAEEALVGFDARAALVSSDGNAALVAGDATIAVLKRHGANVAARRLLPPLHVRRTVEGVAVATGERMFGDVVLHGVTDDEVAALAGPLAPHLRAV
ncbi:MAG: hypothetical protein V4659_05060 [Pseudomonadota bacterium]